MNPVRNYSLKDVCCKGHSVNFTSNFQGSEFPCDVVEGQCGGCGKIDLACTCVHPDPENYLYNNFGVK